jgi:hypothetical protein
VWSTHLHIARTLTLMMSDAKLEAVARKLLSKADLVNTTIKSLLGGCGLVWDGVRADFALLPPCDNECRQSALTALALRPLGAVAPCPRRACPQRFSVPHRRLVVVRPRIPHSLPHCTMVLVAVQAEAEMGLAKGALKPRKGEFQELVLRLFQESAEKKKEEEETGNGTKKSGKTQDRANQDDSESESGSDNGGRSSSDGDTNSGSDAGSGGQDDGSPKKASRRPKRKLVKRPAAAAAAKKAPAKSKPQKRRLDDKQPVRACDVSGSTCHVRRCRHATTDEDCTTRLLCQRGDARRCSLYP